MQVKSSHVSGQKKMNQPIKLNFLNQINLQCFWRHVHLKTSPWLVQGI